MLNDHVPLAEQTDDLVYALQRIEQLRKCPGYSAITMCAENPNQVGQMGVDQVVDGKTPDGVDYTWVKRRDGGQ
jgi:hypothetical protein